MLGGNINLLSSALLYATGFISLCDADVLTPRFTAVRKKWRT
jgi:hypothetical protein